MSNSASWQDKPQREATCVIANMLCYFLPHICSRHWSHIWITIADTSLVHMFTSLRLKRTSPRPPLPSSLFHVGVVTAYERGENLVGSQLQGLQLQMSINNPIMGFRFKWEAICNKKVAITAVCVCVCPLLSTLCYAKCPHNASLFSEGESFSLSPVCSSPAIFPCGWKWAEENLPGEEPRHEVSQIRSQPLHSTYRCLDQEIYMHPNLSR